MTVRVAVAVGYLGRGYSGSQVQPNVPTVQGELQEALIQLNWCEHGAHHPVTLSSRTDGGVDARMNIGSFVISNQIWDGCGERGVITALNDHIQTNIRVWAVQSVDPGFRTRDAHSRTYLYRLQALEGWPAVSISSLTSWCSLFVGEHDFRNFCRPQEGRSTVKRVLSCEPWLDDSGAILGFSIKAEGFVWNQVRRIASAMLGIAKGQFSIEEVGEALSSPENAADFGRVEPEWLTLWSIEHSGTPYLMDKAKTHFDSPLVAVTPSTGRAYPLWANKARAEQDQLHQAAWLLHLN